MYPGKASPAVTESAWSKPFSTAQPTTVPAGTAAAAAATADPATAARAVPCRRVQQLGAAPGHKRGSH